MLDNETKQKIKELEDYVNGLMLEHFPEGIPEIVEVIKPKPKRKRKKKSDLPPE